MAQRPYSTLHSPDDNLNFGNPQASQYSLHTPIDENPFYPTSSTPRVPSPPIGTSPNDIPLKSHPDHQQYPTPHGTPAPGYSSPHVGSSAAPSYKSPQIGTDSSSHPQTATPYIPLYGLPAFPPPPSSSQSHLVGPATSPPPTQHLPPIPPEPAHTHPTGADRPITPKTPVYTPAGGSGPNGGIHAPGQIGHPNQQHGRDEYHHGMCDCFSDLSACCTGYWCPCILYSQTKHRIKTSPNSNLNDFKTVNPHCMAFCALAPVAWVFTMLQRTRVREKYQLQGSIGGDCARAYCCGPCTIVQDEREVKDREDERRRFAGPGSGSVGGGSSAGYKSGETMVYKRVDL